MALISTPPHTSWTHRLARVLVRPMVGTRITPNHLTTGRLVTGIAACAAFLPGEPNWNLWGGILWLLSCLLDRADGELARLGGTSSAGGHRYDYYCDVAVNSLFFLAIGIGIGLGNGLENSGISSWAVALGVLSGLSVAIASVLSERFEEASDDDGKAYSGILGFDFDDILYLFGPAAWFGWFPYILIGASICGPIIAVLTWVRLSHLRKRN
ncbi:MAG: CDP-alcohol phosphatidyltransferase family protein [Rhodospirillaceae bacterium]|jgi:archaetidylinositol phosphate synthase|nr:CDP-alcohol phosphatidyltransferase family protein [Rhodospirillaceae bacterium]MBT5373316.1 CDP-alcohol phosphatidyltransferase family protein [Rhodospirillaceae bacterium]MBT5659948.1 CDP-alcohol phosphatidyltransferase family protein [Rhodospirillaceae bacterium]MBT5751258.1 CDP-alcohol phosphatidyltransferase family protein [Rhodospirillaceae bacterium]